MKITKEQQESLDFLVAGVLADQIVAMDTFDKESNRSVPLVCVVGPHEDDNKRRVYPVAILLTDEDFDRFIPPLGENEYGMGEGTPWTPCTDEAKETVNA